MKKLKHNISIYIAMFVASIKSILEYRVDFIVGMISQFLTQVVELIFIWIVFQNTSSLAGWNMEQLLLMYGLMMFSIAIVDLFFDGTFDMGPKFIKDGDFDMLLLRPVHPLISVISSSKSVTTFGYFAISLTLIITMLIKLEISITFLLIIKIIFFGIVGGFILGAILTLFSVVSFWTYRSNEVMWSVYRTYTFAQYPVEIYNKFIKILITFVFPFVFVAYYPTSNYLDLGNSNIVYLSPFVMILLWIIAIKIWNIRFKEI